MDKKRIFTADELAELGKSPSTRAIEMAQSGDPQLAVAAVKMMETMFTAIHDMYGDWVASLLSYIYRKEGVEAAEEAMTPLVRAYMDPSLENYDKLSYRDKVVNGIQGLAFAHNATVIAEEDDEKVTYHMEFCKAGQRQVANGLYDGDCAQCSRVESCSCTWSIGNFPIYCIHAPIQDKISIDKIGHPNSVYSPCKDMGREACRVSIYKDPKDIPEEAYTRIGYTKPEM